VGLFVAQPNAVQTNAWQAPGYVTTASIYGYSTLYGYLDALYFFDNQTDVIRVAGELSEINVLDAPTVVYTGGQNLTVLVEYEARFVYAPRNFD
jgi:hypothetical protein